MEAEFLVTLWVYYWGLKICQFLTHQLYLIFRKGLKDIIKNELGLSLSR